MCTCVQCAELALHLSSSKTFRINPRQCTPVWDVWMQFLYKKWWEEVTQEMSELLFGWQIEWAISDIHKWHSHTCTLCLNKYVMLTFSMACAPSCCPSFLLVQVPVTMWCSPSESLYTSCCFSLVVGSRAKSSSPCRRPWFLYAHMVQLKKHILDCEKGTRHSILFFSFKYWWFQTLMSP